MSKVECGMSLCPVQDLSLISADTKAYVYAVSSQWRPQVQTNGTVQERDLAGVCVLVHCGVSKYTDLYCQTTLDYNHNP